MQLTEHFTFEELTVSQTAARLGLLNQPNDVALKNLFKTAEGLEAIRSLIGCAIVVTSGYRSEAVNKEVGGSPKSQHCTGQAADIIAPSFGSPLDLAREIEDSIVKLGVDQLILEYHRWVHVSFSDQPRFEVWTKLSGQPLLPGLVPLPPA